MKTGTTMQSLIHNKILRALVGLLGLVVLGGSLATLLAGISSELSAGANNDIGGVIFASLCMLFTSGIGGVLTWFGYHGLFGDPPPDPALQRQILELAEQHDGRVTIARVAADTDLTLERAEFLLEDLAKKGLARLDLDEDGNRLFVFAGLEQTLLPEGDEARNALQEEIAEEQERREG